MSSLSRTGPMAARSCLTSGRVRKPSTTPRTHRPKQRRPLRFKKALRRDTLPVALASLCSLYWSTHGTDQACTCKAQYRWGGQRVNTGEAQYRWRRWRVKTGCDAPARLGSMWIPGVYRVELALGRWRPVLRGDRRYGQHTRLGPRG